MYTETGDPAALKAYNHYVKEIKEIKEKIIESEKNDKVVWLRTMYWNGRYYVS